MSIPKREWKKRSWFNWKYVHHERRRSYILFYMVSWSILSFWFLNRYVFSSGLVTDVSMTPTFSDHTYVLINKYLYRLKPPERRDIVVLRKYRYATDQYVKRVIGLPGDQLLFSQGKVYINGKLLDEPYVMGTTYPNVGPFVVPQGCYFVMGDNRQNSEDSRRFGSIPLENIAGKIGEGKWFPLN